MPGDEPMEADGLGKLRAVLLIHLDVRGGVQQAQAVEFAPDGGPLGRVVRGLGEGFRMAMAGELFQPGERDRIRHEEAGKLQGRAGRRAEALEGPLHEGGDMVLRDFRPMADFLPHRLLARQHVHAGDALPAELREIVRGPVALLRPVAEIGGDEFHGERVAAEGAGDVAGGGFLGVVREAVPRLEVAQQMQRIRLRQHLHLDMGKGAVAAAEFVRVEPGGDDEFQPFLGGQPGDLRGGEQLRAVHVVEDEQGAGLLDFREVGLRAVMLRMALKGRAHGGDARGGDGAQVIEHRDGGERVVVALRLGNVQRHPDFRAEPLEARVIGQPQQHRARLGRALAAHLPRPARRVELRIRMGILPGERRLSQTAGTVRRRDHAPPAHAASAALRPAGGHERVQRAQLLVPPDEMLVAARDIPRREIGQRDAVEAVRDVFVQGREPFRERARVGGRIARIGLHGGGALGRIELFEDFRAAREPGLEFQRDGFVASAQISDERAGALLGVRRQLLERRLEPRVFLLHRRQPRGQLLILRQPQVRGRDEEHGRDAIIPARRRVLAPEVFVPFPQTVLRGEIMRREKRQEELRLPEALAQPPPPVRALRNAFLVKEDAQFAPRPRPMTTPEFALEGRDPALALRIDRLFIIPPGVGEKEVKRAVRHGRVACGVRSKFAGSAPAAAQRLGIFHGAHASFYPSCPGPQARSQRGAARPRSAGDPPASPPGTVPSAASPSRRSMRKERTGRLPLRPIFSQSLRGSVSSRGAGRGVPQNTAEIGRAQ